MAFIVVGTSHRYSPLRLRERISFSMQAIENALGFLKETGALKSCVILSTCNRVELYASTDEPESGISEIVHFISRYHEIGKKELCPYLYIYRERDAVRHLFRVTSGLDSLVLGESQILGQVRSAFLEAQKRGFGGYLFDKVFNSAISLAGRLHRETRISEGKVSIGSVAIDFIKEKTGPLSGKNILIIGVSKVTGLVLRYLKNEGDNVVFISNRTFEKARALASRIGARAVRFDNLRQYLGKADIVITATRSPHFIIGEEQLRRVVRERPLLIVDLALPRDVDPRVKEIKEIKLFGLEELGAAIQKNRDKRRIEAEKAEDIIDKEAGILWEELSGLGQGQACLP